MKGGTESANAPFSDSSEEERTSEREPNKNVLEYHTSLDFVIVPFDHDWNNLDS